jgi:hypothetical protein
VLLEISTIDIFSYSEHQKVQIVAQIFETKNYFSGFDIPKAHFCQFLEELRARYNKKGN